VPVERFPKALRALALAALLGATPLAMAQQSVADPGLAPTVAPDPQLESDVMELSHKLRCLVCQNQSIAESNAPLAVDLRNQVREQLASGRSKDDVVDYLVDRYGDFVLYEPPFKAATALLWLGRIGSVVPAIGGEPLLIAFIATVIGGMRSLPGAVLGGYLLALIVTTLNYTLPSDLLKFKDAFTFSLVILILLWRPDGLLKGPATGQRT